MKFKYLGKTKIRLSEIGLGTWKMEGREEEISSIRHSISLGVNLVDTAEMYGNEEAVGMAIRDSDAYIATKVSPNHFRRDLIIKSCKESIKRLGVDSIDLYQLHWPNPNIDIKETMSAMESLVDDGLVGNIGVSNFSLDELIEAQGAMKKYEIASNQIEGSVLVRDHIDELGSYCKKNKITLIAYSPLARGMIYSNSHAKMNAILDEIAKRRNKSISQIALNWLLSVDNLIAIPKASNVRHAIENANASGWNLNAKEISMINRTDDFIRPLSAQIKPVIRFAAPFMGAYTKINKIKSGRHLKSKTARSSKKK